jgi:hypothetical protein
VNEEADCQANKARHGQGYIVHYRVYTSAAKSTRRISEGSMATKAQCVAERCSKHSGYRLKGKTGSKRCIPMTGMKSLAARFYRLIRGHAPTAACLTRLGHQDICWWRSWRAVQMREHRFHHCSRWTDQQKILWNTVAKATGWKAGRCRHVQISELSSMEICNQAPMDFVAAAKIRKLPPWNAEERGVAEIPDQEIAHSSFRRKLRKWRFRFEEHREGVAAAR